VSSTSPNPPAPIHHLTFVSTSEDQTVALGESLGRLLRPGDVLGLDGDLGTGKTRLVRGIAESLGVNPAQVSSPTYVLIHEYRPGGPGAGTPSNRHVGAATPLFHMDAYRLSGPDELDSLGMDRVLEAFGVTVIEWFERIAAGLSDEPSLARMRLESIGPEQRRLDLVAPPSWTLRPEWDRLALSAEPAGADEPGSSASLPPGWARCPVSGRPVPPEAPTFPFADERAKLADLGRWLSGAYVVSRGMTEDDLNDPDLDTSGGAEPGRDGPR